MIATTDGGGQPPFRDCTKQHSRMQWRRGALWRIAKQYMCFCGTELALNGFMCLHQMRLESTREEGLELMQMVTEHALARPKK